MNQELILEKLVAKLGEDAVQASRTADQITVTVPKDRILEACNLLKYDSDFLFDFLSFVGGVDKYPNAPRFEVVYQLYSLKHNHRFRVKTLLEEDPDGTASIDSVVSIWPTANWHERETAEMYGIVFRNHPDPRRLLTPEGWKIHPLRKDFPLEGTEADTPDLLPKA
jgi:NADH-quinone oxidoreductase subunit C